MAVRACKRRLGDPPAGRLVDPIGLRLSSLSAGPDAMAAGVVFAGCTIPPDGLPMVHAPAAGPWGRSGRDGVGVVCLCLAGSGWMPNLRMSVGGYRPQFPVTESMRFPRRAFLPVLAMHDDEDMGPPCLFEVVRIGHKIAPGSQDKVWLPSRWTARGGSATRATATEPTGLSSASFTRAKLIWI